MRWMKTWIAAPGPSPVRSRNGTLLNVAAKRISLAALALVACESTSKTPMWDPAPVDHSTVSFCWEASVPDDPALCFDARARMAFHERTVSSS